MKIILYILIGWFNHIKYRLSNKYKKDIYEMYIKRMQICEKCTFYDITKEICKECGCYMHIKTKIKFQLDENDKSIDGCPKKFW